MKRILQVLLICLAVGCAKVPSGGVGVTTKRLVFTMTMASNINPNFIYAVAFNPSNDLNPTVTGPIPIVAPPWGNGIVAGNCQYFVMWSQNQSPNYLIYQFLDPNLINYRQIGIPVNYVDPTNSKVIQFELDLSQIAPTIDAANAYQSLQINFLTMDRIPNGGAGSKNWDALGNSTLPTQINNWITVPLNTDGIYNNTFYSNLEPTGDSPDPSLDITDFSVQVRSQ